MLYIVQEKKTLFHMATVLNYHKIIKTSETKTVYNYIWAQFNELWKMQ